MTNRSGQNIQFSSPQVQLVKVTDLKEMLSKSNLVVFNIQVDEINGIPIPFVWVYTDHPALACLGCQKAGWKIELDNFKAIASGPARALALKPRETYELIDYEDDTDYAVIVLETDTLPNAEVMEYIARECDVDVEETYAVVAPTRSLVGSIQISARVLETALFKMVQLGYDPKLVRNAIGRAPIAPIMGDNVRAMGATNDSIIYYGSAILTVDRYEEVLENLPSEISLTYGGSHYLVLTDFKPGGLFSGYIEYRRPTELDKTIQKQLKKYPVEFRYRSKYSFNPDGSDAIFLVPVTFNGKLKALRPGGFITQKTEWINEPTESVKLGDRFYFKSLPVKDEVLPQGYIFEYSTAAKKQTKYIEIL